jgi:hypothetical protein
MPPQKIAKALGGKAHRTGGARRVSENVRDAFMLEGAGGMSFPVIVGGAAAKMSSKDELRRCCGPVAFGSCHVYAAAEL